MPRSKGRWVVGVRLIVEVLDHWRDAGLTAGERDDLVVLAENANDKSRETWGPVHEDYILRRVNKSAASWRIAINRLMKKGALEYAARGGKELRGRTGQTAVYMLTPLCPEAPHDGWKGFCTRPARVTGEAAEGAEPAEESHLSDASLGCLSANPAEASGHEVGYLTANPAGYPSANPVEGEGYLTATERVSGQLTPTPPVSSFKTPSKTSSSPAAPSPAAGQGPVTERGGGGVSSFEGPTGVGPSAGQGVATAPPSEQNPQAEPLVAALDFRGRPPGAKQRRQLVTLTAAALDAGWVEQDLRTYLDLGGAAVNSAAAVYAHRLAPDELPDPAAFREASRRPLEGTDAVVDGWMALSRQLGGDEREHAPAGHRPSGRRGYSGPARPNTVWDRIAADAANGVSPPGAERYKHCGTCDPVTRMRDGDGWSGGEKSNPCARCHPSMQFS